MRYPILPISQRVHERSPHPHPLCAQTERLDHVRASSDPTVDIYLAFATSEDLWVELVDLQEGVEGWWRAGSAKGNG
jgi:hypothetical protein